MRGTDLNLGVWCGQQRQARYVLGAALQNLLWNARIGRENSGDGQKCGVDLRAALHGVLDKRQLPRREAAEDPASSRRSTSCWG